MDIKNETQLGRAAVEDEIIDLMLKNYGRFVMHGGTCVWRCYGGNRFSRDVDFYSNLDPSKESAFQKELHKLLVENGYPIREEKYNSRTKTLHVIFRGGDTTGKLDITFAKAKGIAVEYLKVDGAKRILHALPPDALLQEKMDAYLDMYETGAHQIQDLYDILVLKDRMGKPEGAVCRRIREFIAKVRESPPRDEKVLKQLLLSGVAPGFAEIMLMLERWLDDACR